jgi:hypothetical protein
LISDKGIAVKTLSTLLPSVALATLACLAAPELARAQQTSPLAPPPLPPDDTQIWNETQISIPLHDKADLVILQFVRLGFEESFRSDTRTGAGIQIKLNKYYTVQPTYVYQYARPGDGRKSYSHRLYVDNNVKVPLGKVTLPNRVRVERVVRHGGSDRWNFRFRPGVEVPIEVGGQKLSLFANNEIFYDTGPRAWTRNRFIGGVSKKLSDRFTADFWYMHQNDGFSTPGDIQAFGTTFKIKLPELD